MSPHLEESSAASAYASRISAKTSVHKLKISLESLDRTSGLPVATRLAIPIAANLRCCGSDKLSNWNYRCRLNPRKNMKVLTLLHHWFNRPSQSGGSGTAFAEAVAAIRYKRARESTSAIRAMAKMYSVRIGTLAFTAVHYQHVIVSVHGSLLTSSSVMV